jgi:signal transduction histidine kinase/ActR/RegA family two-component response regulator
MWDRAPDADVVLVLAPAGRDAALACRMLSRAGVDARACADFDEILTDAHVARLSRVLDAQPPWSDLPIVVFAATANRIHGDAAARLTALGNVTVIDRPVRRRTMVTAVRAALRSRRRQYEARRAIAGRDEFLAMLGHELRNPLAAILLATEILNRRAAAGNGSDETRLALIDRQTRHLARLVDDLLDVARLTSGKVTLKRETVDVGSLVERCLQAVEPMARGQGLHLTVRRTAEDLVVDGDVVRLEQVVTNLLTNAIKYTPAGGEVDVAAGRERGTITVQVRDTGVGIAPDDLDSIFDMFVQAPRGLERAAGGLGLGLTLVRALVEMHGGTVAARSEGPGRGSEFSVRLPATEPATDAAVVPAGTPGAGDVRRRVVVIEDNDDIRALLAEVLAASGHEVETVADGASGLSRLLAAPPDVALVDIGLPGCSGYDVARAVRSDVGDAIVLVAMTGYGQPEDRARAIAAGFDDHLTKPVDVEALERVLAARSPRRAARSEQEPPRRDVHHQPDADEQAEQ